MDAEIIALLKTLEPPLQVGLGAWIGAYFTGRSSLRAIKAQNDQREAEWRRDKEVKEKEVLKEWFEDYAITKCVDPLLTEVFSLKSVLGAKAVELTHNDSVPGQPNPNTAPYDACVKLLTITGASNTHVVFDVLRLVPTAKIGPDQLKAGMIALNTLVLYLLRLKQYLLTTDIASKSDIYKLCTEPKIEKLGRGIDKLWEDFQQALGNPATDSSPMAMYMKRMAENAD